MKNWKSTLAGLALIFIRAWLDSQTPATPAKMAESAPTYIAGAGLVVAADARRGGNSL